MNPFHTMHDSVAAMGAISYCLLIPLVLDGKESRHHDWMTVHMTCCYLCNIL